MELNHKGRSWQTQDTRKRHRYTSERDPQKRGLRQWWWGGRERWHAEGCRKHGHGEGSRCQGTRTRDLKDLVVESKEEMLASLPLGLESVQEPKDSSQNASSVSPSN